jgi:hypothetical protein
MNNFEKALDDGKIDFGLPLKEYECIYKRENTPVIVIPDLEPEDKPTDNNDNNEIDEEEEAPPLPDPIKPQNPESENEPENTNPPKEEIPEESKEPEPEEQKEEESKENPILIHNPNTPKPTDANTEEKPEEKPKETPTRDPEPENSSESKPKIDGRYYMIGIILMSIILLILMICCCCCCRKKTQPALGNMQTISLNSTQGTQGQIIIQPQYALKSQPVILSNQMNVIQQPQLVVRSIQTVPQQPVRYVYQ